MKNFLKCWIKGLNGNFGNLDTHTYVQGYNAWLNSLGFKWAHTHAHKYTHICVMWLWICITYNRQIYNISRTKSHNLKDPHPVLQFSSTNPSKPGVKTSMKMQLERRRQAMDTPTTAEWSKFTLQWRHNEHDSASNHQSHDCLLNRLFRRRSKKTSRVCVTGLCARNSPGAGEFPAQIASNAENVSIWWRLHVERRRQAMDAPTTAEWSKFIV